jgi:hypothetical protein
MTVTGLRKLAKSDPVVISIHSYKDACCKHISSLTDMDPDLMSHTLSADRYLRFMNYLQEESFQQFLDRLFTILEESIPTIKGIDDPDALRILYWFAESQLQLISSAHHILFDAYCKNLSKENSAKPIRKGAKR